MTLSHSAPLNPSEEHALVLRAQAGDRDAQYALVSSQVPFLRNEARKYAGGHGKDDPEDLFSAGVEAMLGALETFDPTRGTRFITHAKFVVREAMADEVAAHGRNISVPGRTLRKYRKAVRETETMEAAREYAQDREGMDPATFDAVHFALTGERSLDDFGADYHGATTGSQASAASEGAGTYLGNGAGGASIPSDALVLGSRGPAATDTESAYEARDLARQALAVLDERQRQVIALTVLSDDPMTDAEVAKTLGVSRPTVTRTRAAALQVMHAALTA